MLSVTDKAAQYVRETLKKRSAPGAVRIVKTEDGYHLTLDEAKEGDQVFEHEGENYLLLKMKAVRRRLRRVPPDARRDLRRLRLSLPGTVHADPGPAGLLQRLLLQA